ncbi:hypothetical protein DL98DRAFT_517352 [Cadophora sp. DSE1049]|nr:hypothetical protein DL98DRAFT_517352 [Cadophora sp. DSE1049]
MEWKGIKVLSSGTSGTVTLFQHSFHSTPLAPLHLIPSSQPSQPSQPPKLLNPNKSSLSPHKSPSRPPLSRNIAIRLG